MLVVADTSVLINLCRIGQEELLAALFREVWIPMAVEAEFVRLAAQVPRFRGLTCPAWIHRGSPAGIPPELSGNAKLDLGERQAIALALEMSADAVLMDESAGRIAVIRLGLEFIGVAGILLRAKQGALISAVGPIIERLEAEAHFWLAQPFREHVLRLAGEAP